MTLEEFYRKNSLCIDYEFSLDIGKLVIEECIRAIQEEVERNNKLSAGLLPEILKKHWRL